MKLTTFILIISLMQVSAATFGQKLTLNENNVSLEKVLREIRRQTGYDVMIGSNKFQTSRRINANFNNVPLEAVMDKIVQGSDLMYSIEEKTVIIKEKEEPSFLDRLISRFANITVDGRVVDASGNGIPGATITIKGGKKLTVTGVNGIFSISNVEENAALVISYIGYQTKEVSAKSKLGDVVLELSDNPLDEVQIQAYGTTSRRLSTSNISTVKAEDIAKSPVQNPLLALQGRAPGIFLEQSTGLPGSRVTVRIQGTNSLTKGNDPFYVIDGVPYSSQMLPTWTSLFGAPENDLFDKNGSGSPLNFINPSDIESIDILKDADATSIYGSRAANGAIIITTKRGKAGKTRFDVNFQQGFGEVGNRIKLLNTEQQLELRKEAYKNDNLNYTTQPLSSSNADLKMFDQVKYTDWQKELIGGTSKYTDAQLSLTGGSQNTQFLINGGYKRETTVFPGDNADQKGSLHFRVNNTSLDQRFKMDFSGSYLYDVNRLPSNDLTSDALNRPLNAPDLYNSDGSLNFGLMPNGVSPSGNPLRYLFNQYRIQNKNLILSGNIGYEIIKNLTLKSAFGYNDLQTDELNSITTLSALPQDKANASAIGYYGLGNSSGVSIEPQLSYIHTLSKGKLELLLGGTYQQNIRKGQRLYGTGYVNDLVVGDINSAGTLVKNGSTNTDYKYIATFGRLNYNWENKYIINFTARRDGSSRFGSENRFNNFYSGAGAWIFSNENFFKRNLTFISFGKLKASYGTTGNDQIGDYKFLNLYDPLNGLIRPYQGSASIVPNGLPNEYLQWEETKKISLGIDLGFLNDRFLLNTNYYRNRSSNQLLNYNLPGTTGFSGIQQNLPATIQNTGWETSLTADIVREKSFSWSLNANLTIPNNKLVEYPSLETSTYANTLIVGQSINIVRVYQYAGVNSTTGLYQFVDKNGQITSSPGSGVENRIVNINLDPKFYGGVQNSITYKGLQLDILLQFVKQDAKSLLANYVLPGFSAQPLPVEFLNRWKSPGDNSELQQVGAALKIDRLNASTAASNSTQFFGDASYIRLKNLSLSWQFPDAWKQKAKLNNAKFFVQGQNLFTVTKYLGFDPENRSTTSLPPLRMITLGIQVSL